METLVNILDKKLWGTTITIRYLVSRSDTPE